MVRKTLSNTRLPAVSPLGCIVSDTRLDLQLDLSPQGLGNSRSGSKKRGHPMQSLWVALTRACMHNPSAMQEMHVPAGCM